MKVSKKATLTGELETSQGRLAYREWKNRPHRAVLVQLHGIESHSGWFVEFADQLQAEGCAVYALDRLGSGLSQGQRGHVDAWRVWLEHVELLLQHARTRHPGLPLYLIGSCWGAKVAVALALRKPHLLDGLILLAPALKTRLKLDPVSMLLLLASLLSSWTPYLSIPIRREEMFTRHEPHLSFIRQDPLRLKRVTSRFLVESHKLDRFTLDNLRDLAVPTLALLAGRDEIVDTPAVRSLLNSVDSSRVTLRWLASAFHSIEFEPKRRELIRSMVDWIEIQPRIGAQAS